MMLKNNPVKNNKRKPSEKRKKKSRDAARSRRSKESQLFNEMLHLLPLQRPLLSSLDKSTSMRLFISYIQLRQFVLRMDYSDILNCTSKDLIANPLYGEAIDGFLLILSISGNIIYLSESVDKYLGISQVDLLGQSLFDFSHPCDHEDIRGMLTVDQTKLDTTHRLLRMKCSVSKRETKVKPASYKVVRCVGRIVKEKRPSGKLQKDSDENANKNAFNFVSIASPIPHPSNIETFLGRSTFLSRHNTDMKFTYIDSRIHELLHYDDKDLLEKSLYLFIHPLDIRQTRDKFKELFKKGQCDTDVYRFMVSDGGFVWIVTQATLIYNNKNGSVASSRTAQQSDKSSSEHPQCIVCVHYINSEIIGRNEVVADHQLKPNQTTTAPSLVSEIKKTSSESHVPLQSTNSIFSPRTPQDMNTGYLSINDIGASDHHDLRDDPDDLTHLAPTPGDACIPLDFSTFSDENLDAWISDQHSSQQQELSPISDSLSFISSDLSHSPLRNDPFLSYRDDGIPCDSESSHEIFKDVSNGACSLNSEHDCKILDPESSQDELLTDEGFGSLPLGDFPSLSVTDSILWNNSSDQPYSSPKFHQSKEEQNATRYSNLARLLQTESTNKSSCKNNNNYDTANHDHVVQIEYGSHHPITKEPSHDKITNYNLKHCHVSENSYCHENSEHSYCDKNTSKLPVGSGGKNFPSSVKVEYNDQSPLKRQFKEDQEKSKVIKKVRRNQNNLLNENKESVLMNLLMNGQDSTIEYNSNKVQPNISSSTSLQITASKNKSSKSTEKSVTTLAQLLLSDTTKSMPGTPVSNLVYLTREDAEVNAPTQSHDGLLTGRELLNALELVDDNSIGVHCGT